MKLSCLPVSFFADIVAGRMKLGEWAKMGVELGLDAIDVSLLFYPDWSSQAVAQKRRDVEDQGISLAMITTYPDFTHPDAAQRAQELDRARQTVELAAGLGAKFLRATAGQAHPQTSSAQGVAWAAEGLSALVASAQGSGVTILFENHGNPGVWQYPDFTSDPEMFLAIYQATEGAGLGVNFDTGNAAAYAADPVALLTQVLDRVVTIHAADAMVVNGEFRPMVIGSGPTPFAALFRRLHEAKWDNWICIEEAGKLGRPGVEAAVRLIRQVWADTAL